MDYLERSLFYAKWALASAAMFIKTLPLLTQTLLMLMVIDTVLGVLAAWYRNDASPSEFWKGVTKKIGTLLVVVTTGVIGPHVQELIGINLLMAASAFYASVELLSIIRNASLLGVENFGQLGEIAEKFRGIGKNGKQE